jgi:hypothetical protein
MLAKLNEHVILGLFLLVAALESRALNGLNVSDDSGNVLQPQFRADNAQVTDWVDVALNVGDLIVGKGTADVEKGIARANVGEESVSKTLLGCKCK